jgi:hypothetical protein
MSHASLKFVVLLTTAVALSGCTNFSLFKDNDAEPTQMPEENQLGANPTGALSASDISTLLSGKSWKWRGPNNSGTTLFAADGTSLVEVDGKGTTTGKWMAKDGQLCESVAPAPFIPNGSPMQCRPMSGGTGGQYQVGTATFTLSS